MKENIYEVTEIKTAETIAVRIRTTVRNTQKIMLDAAISIGQDLIDAKELVAHGEWKDWLENSVGFSYESAKKYMQISREYSDFSKRELITDLSYTKALKLLAVSEDEREEFIETNDLEDMTVKELEAKIKALEDEKATSEDKLRSLEDNISLERRDRLSLEFQAQELKKQIEELGTTDGTTDGTISEEAQAQIKKAMEDLEKAENSLTKSDKKVDKLQDEIKQLKESLEKEIEGAKAAAIEEGKAQGKQENEEELLRQKKIADEAQQAKQDAEKKLASSADEDLMQFKFFINQLQDVFNNAISSLGNIEINDKEKAEKLRGGLHAILGSLQEKLGDYYGK